MAGTGFCLEEYFGNEGLGLGLVKRLYNLVHLFYVEGFGDTSVELFSDSLKTSHSWNLFKYLSFLEELNVPKPQKNPFSSQPQA